jgi:hypothetical protein
VDADEARRCGQARPPQVAIAEGQGRKEGIYTEDAEGLETERAKRARRAVLLQQKEEANYDRKRTDSRWNILMAMKRAAAA